MKLTTTLLTLSLAAPSFAWAQDAEPKPETKPEPAKAEGKDEAKPAAPAEKAKEMAVDQLKKFITENGAKIDKSQASWKTRLPKPPQLTFDANTDYFWTMKTNFGEIKIKYYADVAPQHVSSSMYLAELGFYDDLIFHRVLKGFMAQGGCPLGNGMGNPGYSVNLEVNPKVKHSKRGILSAARSQNVNSAGSQFFLTFKETSFLDNNYTVYGEIVSGIEVLDEFEKRGAAQEPGRPSETLKLEKSTISTAPKAKS